MKHSILPALVLCVAAGFLVSCEKFTQKRFETIQAGQTKMAVEKTLGAPQARWDDTWRWVNWDKNCSAVVRFDPNGEVIGKAWTEMNRQEQDIDTKWCEGNWPGDDNDNSPPKDK